MAIKEKLDAMKPYLPKFWVAFFVVFGTGMKLLDLFHFYEKRDCKSSVLNQICSSWARMFNGLFPKLVTPLVTF